MSVIPAISIATIRQELQACEEDAEQFGWVISSIDENDLSFTVRITSPIDEEVYILYFKFDNYPELPPLLDFIDPVSGEMGIRRAYPLTKDGNFFHTHPIICHPCSRKSYGGFSGVHADWNLTGWKNNAYTGSLQTVQAVLQAINARIVYKTYYHGRMQKN
ncbi:hypothetical protein GCM10023189_32850 [Nibrella saemangeumensis]|uniref:Uncharacterized protein n=1 Tax=Nibrella saemangeumensis TaxID=1084526 RepID=A0ABP8N3M8_9BACT